jgi:inorganic pyrophosphatase
LEIEEKVPSSISSFWAYLDQFIRACSVIIDRSMNSPHPRYPELIYPLDYGHLEGTSAVNSGGWTYGWVLPEPIN